MEHNHYRLKPLTMHSKLRESMLTLVTCWVYLNLGALSNGPGCQVYTWFWLHFPCPLPVLQWHPWFTGVAIFFTLSLSTNSLSKLSYLKKDILFATSNSSSKADANI